MNDPHGNPRPPGLADGPIYLDYNATTPVDPRVVAAMVPYLETHFGNPSSAHHYAERPRTALAEAREQVAGLIGATADAIVFTGSGSESDTLAIRGAVLAHYRPGAHVITQQTEHPAVLSACESLRRWHGVDITVLPVDSDGLIDLDAFARAITDRTVLASIMLANNETGTLQPVAELVELAHAGGVLVHTDAAQAVGKVPVDVRSLGVDLLTIAGHKLYAPKGVGALYVRPGLRLEPQVQGGGQERGLRAGTENVAAAVALGAAAELATGSLAAGEPDRLCPLRDDLHRRLAERFPGQVVLNGHPTRRLPNTVNLALIPGGGENLLAAAGVAASTGSACHAGTNTPSPVLRAMGLADERARCAVRFSLGRWTTPDDIQRTVTHLAAAAAAVSPTARR